MAWEGWSHTIWCLIRVGQACGIPRILSVSVLPCPVSSASVPHSSRGECPGYHGVPGESVCSLAWGVPPTPFYNPPVLILCCWNEGWLWEPRLSQSRIWRSNNVCLVWCIRCTGLAWSTFHSHARVVYTGCIQIRQIKLPVLGELRERKSVERDILRGERGASLQRLLCIVHCSVQTLGISWGSSLKN